MEILDVVVLTATRVIESLPYFLIGLVLLVAGKWVFDKLKSDIQFDEELTTKDNPAFGVFLAAFLVAIGIAVAGASYGVEVSLLDDLIPVVSYGVLAVVLLLLSIWINDLLILRKFDIYKEMITDRNLGTGIAVAGGTLATGLMLNGALTGESDSFVMGLRDLVVYWAIGQALLVIGGFCFQAMTKYDVHHEIGERDNVAVGISFGGYLLALGILIRASMVGATSNLMEEIPVTIVVAVAGLILLAMARVIADWVFLPKSSLTQEVAKEKNAAAGAIAAASFIVVAILLAAALGATIAPSGPEVLEAVTEALPVAELSAQ